jgi:hypothetical protein
MRQRFARIIAGAAIGTLIALTGTPASAKTTKECDAEYASRKVDIQAAKEKKADFISACKALATGQDTPIAAGGGAAAAPATPAPAPAAAAPATPPAAPKAPASTMSASRPTSTGASGANEYSTVADAKAKCGSDIVVWVNLKSKIYHFAGNRDYGNTKEGTYMCEKEAMAGGDRAAKNEKHP